MIRAALFRGEPEEGLGWGSLCRREADGWKILKMFSSDKKAKSFFLDAPPTIISQHPIHPSAPVQFSECVALSILILYFGLSGSRFAACKNEETLLMICLEDLRFFSRLFSSVKLSFFFFCRIFCASLSLLFNSSSNNSWTMKVLNFL